MRSEKERLTDKTDLLLFRQTRKKSLHLNFRMIERIEKAKSPMGQQTLIDRASLVKFQKRGMMASGVKERRKQEEKPFFFPFSDKNISQPKEAVREGIKEAISPGKIGEKVTGGQPRKARDGRDGPKLREDTRTNHWDRRNPILTINSIEIFRLVQGGKIYQGMVLPLFP